MSRDSLIDRSIALKEQGDLTGALALLDQALREGRDPARAHYQRGLTLVAAARHEEAIAAYRSALDARPAYLKALVNLAVLCLTHGEPAEAEALLARAAPLAGPDDPVFLATVAASKRRRGDAPGAIDHARRAVQAGPELAGAWQELGLCLLLDPRSLEESIEASRRALALEPGRVDASHNLAAALDKAGRPAEALAPADVALKAMPDDPTFQQTKACILLHLDRAADAMPLLESVERARPDHFEAQYNLACGLARTGRAEEAVPHVARALALVPPQHQRAFRAHIPNDPDLAALRGLPSFLALQ